MHEDTPYMHEDTRERTHTGSTPTRFARWCASLVGALVSHMTVQALLVSGAGASAA